MPIDPKYLGLPVKYFTRPRRHRALLVGSQPKERRHVPASRTCRQVAGKQTVCPLEAGSTDRQARPFGNRIARLVWVTSGHPFPGKSYPLCHETRRGCGHRFSPLRAKKRTCRGDAAEGLAYLSDRLRRAGVCVVAGTL